METIIKVHPSELNQKLLDKIKNFIGTGDNIDVTISLREVNAQYQEALNDSIEYAENNQDMITSTMEDFMAYKPTPDSKMRNVAFTPDAFKEYNEWFDTDTSVIDRIKVLIREIDHQPFKGIGKPEPLKGNWAGYWSRRIDHEHRLIYKVSEVSILIVKCKGHYS